MNTKVENKSQKISRSFKKYEKKILEIDWNIWSNFGY
jgi:hypothetical protein